MLTTTMDGVIQTAFFSSSSIHVLDAGLIISSHVTMAAHLLTGKMAYLIK